MEQVKEKISFVYEKINNYKKVFYLCLPLSFSLNYFFLFVQI
jgi:hypothetical protein